MTLYNFLKKTGVDVRDVHSLSGNSLYGELALKNKKIDFEKEVNDATDEELLEIGRVLLLNEYNETKQYFSYQIVEIMIFSFFY